MGITSPCHFMWAHTEGWWLLVVALLPHQEITHTNLCTLGWREQPCTDCMSFWWVNQSPAPTTLQTQTLQPSGPAGTRWRHKGDREDDTVQVQTRSALKHPPVSAAGELQLTAFLRDEVMHIHPYVLCKQAVTRRVAHRQAETIDLPQLSMSKSAIVLRDS